ncbi:Uncharacterised protein [Vibrio owensii]|nr:hypothetical protein ACOMICROBIO_NCLOACGD_02812 [Vibrio sp. B1ASS3]CAE6922268.1 hypothetical protein ACOMICROBIO_NCLOACGD_02812 [Vibrio sp. B1ASS3]SUP92447.1 Uncharacterised protein [Vibrio owensii]
MSELILVKSLVIAQLFACVITLKPFWFRFFILNLKIKHPDITKGGAGINKKAPERGFFKRKIDLTTYYCWFSFSVKMPANSAVLR